MEFTSAEIDASLDGFGESAEGWLAVRRLPAWLLVEQAVTRRQMNVRL